MYSSSFSQLANFSGGGILVSLGSVWASSDAGGVPDEDKSRSTDVGANLNPGSELFSGPKRVGKSQAMLEGVRQFVDATLCPET